MADKEIISREEDLCHNIGVVAVVLDVALGAEVIKAIDLWLPLLVACGEGLVAVLLDRREAVFIKFEGDLPTGNHDVMGVGCCDVAHQVHQ